MKLSISNIAWDSVNDSTAYKAMNSLGFTGLEIAPTKIFGATPYEDLEASKSWATKLSTEEHFKIPSMQSIWYGRKENIFASEEDRMALIGYTKKAIDFAQSINCKNLVFGCPKNRNTSNESDYSIAIDFFREIGEYAFSKGTCIGMEANPAIYGTNFINDTPSALKLIDDVNSKGFRLNLDIGTMVENGESVKILDGHEALVNHVHISEPYLKPIQERELHKDLAQFLHAIGYDKYVSIEMGKAEDFAQVQKVMEYIRGVFK